MKKTVIIGATANPSRYSSIAAEMLRTYGHEIVPLGIRNGEVGGTPILNLLTKPRIAEVDTVTLYIGPRRQPEWYDYILSLRPKRIIFNPGAENSEFEKIAEASGVEVVEGCSMVMLRSGQY